MKIIEVNSKNAENFKNIVKEDKPVLMLYYAEWCPHCQIFKPTWKDIQEELKPKRNIRVAEVEYKDLSFIPKKYKDIISFPTLRVIKGGKIVGEYNAVRTKEDIIKYANKFV